MKGIVVYYSGTGNTAKIAKAIHKGMKDVMEVCDIASLKEANPQDLLDCACLSCRHLSESRDCYRFPRVFGCQDT